MEESLAGKNLVALSEYIETIEGYKPVKPHALHIAYFELVSSNEVVKMEVLKNVRDELRALAEGKGWRAPESSSPYKLLLNALLLDFGFVEEFWYGGAVKLKLTSLGRDYLPELDEHVRKLYRERKKKKNGSR